MSTGVGDVQRNWGPAGEGGEGGEVLGETRCCCRTLIRPGGGLQPQHLLPWGR